MDEEKLIQVSFQIPPSALDSLSRLAEQLRLLTEAAGAPSTPVSKTSEYVESGSFDRSRFYELQRGVSDPQAVRRTVTDIADAPAAAPAVSQTRGAGAIAADVSRIEDAAAVSAGAWGDLADAKGAGDGFSQQSVQVVRTSAPDSGAQYVLPEERGNPLPPVGEMRELALAAVQGEVTGGIEAPVGAGFAVQAQPKVPQGRWGGAAEELSVPDPAPLTAEAVSMAFERDGRRYDNGFPLY